MRVFISFSLRSLLALSLCLAFFLSATIASEVERPKPGLMWSRSELPSVFPLQVKTSPGLNYYLTLTDTKTQDATLAAFVVGGEFFQVLVPPGSFILRFAYGKTWQNEETLFGDGDDTGVFELDAPLTFETRGVGTKAGHLIDLRPFIEDEQAALVSPQSICQSLKIEVEKSDDFNNPIRQIYEMDEAEPLERPQLVDDFHRAEPFDTPSLTRRYIVDSRVCG